MQLSRLVALLLFILAAPGQARMLVLTNATVVDGTGASSRANQTIVIEDGRIRSVVADGAPSLPDDAEIIDLGGKSVLPGLIDGHVHLLPLPDRATALQALLNSGVTTVRELAGDARISRDLAQRQGRGEIAAPAIYYSAVLFGPRFLEDPRARLAARGVEPGTAAWSRAVTADSELAEVIRDARATGATGVKLYASLDENLVSALTQEAQNQGLKVWAHSVIFPARPLAIVAAGADSVIHSRGLIALVQGDVPDSFAEGTQAWVRRQDFAGTPPDDPRFAALFREMVSRGTILESALLADGDPATGPTGDWRDAMRAWSCRITGEAYRAGVTISAGTDTSARAGAIQREMARLVECGLSPLDAIRAATLNNAKAIGIDATHGSIEPGKVADLIVVGGDPSRDIAAVSEVEIVIQGGRIISTTTQ